MGYFLRSVQDEYDDDGNYRGDVPDHLRNQRVRETLRCAKCNLDNRRPVSNTSVCGDCGCPEYITSYEPY